MDNKLLDVSRETNEKIPNIFMQEFNLEEFSEDKLREYKELI